MKRIFIPAITTLAVVAGLIVVAGWNRSRPPLVAITLTERELQLPWNASNEERPSLQLQFEFEERREPLDARNWLPEDRLRALGFDIDTSASSPEEVRSRAVPRIAWVVFEYGGLAWQDVSRRRQLLQRPERFSMATEPSRLVPIDAGLDVEPLLARYTSGHLIMRASIALDYGGSEHSGRLVYGHIRRLHPRSVTVPLELRARLAGLSRQVSRTGDSTTSTPHPPRYEVDLRVGSLGIPYVRDIRRLAN